MDTRLFYILLVTLAALCLVLTTAASFALKGEAAWADLLLNLSAEIFGILVTVFVIERIITSREARAWLPVKRLIYEKLLTAISDFEQQLFAQFLDRISESIPSIRAAEEIDVDLLGERVRESLVHVVAESIMDDRLLFGRDVESNKVRILRVSSPRSEPVRPESIVEYPFLESERALEAYRASISEVLDTSSSLLEAPLLSMLHMLHQQIVQALKDIREGLKDLKSEYPKERWVLGPREEYPSGKWFSEPREEHEKRLRDKRFMQPREEYEEYLREDAFKVLSALSFAAARVMAASREPKVWLEHKLKEGDV